MGKRFFAVLFLSLTVFSTSAQAQSFQKGETLVLKSNMHYDQGKPVLYTLNYQLPGLIPMCDEITVIKKNNKKMVFTWKSVEYIIEHDKHTKKAGVSFDTVLGNYFGKECDADAVGRLSEVDQKGIRKGVPYVGMTRQGILFAMGRPPIHANPDLDSPSWMYWKNRYKRQAIDFNANGAVEEIRL